LEIAVGAMVNTQAVERVKLIPLSADKIARRIQDMLDDIDGQLVENFADNQEPIWILWALQIDESTDIQTRIKNKLRKFKQQKASVKKLFKNSAIFMLKNSLIPFEHDFQV
jgi:hypothetical protein